MIYNLSTDTHHYDAARPEKCVRDLKHECDFGEVVKFKAHIHSKHSLLDHMQCVTFQ